MHIVINIKIIKKKQKKNDNKSTCTSYGEFYQVLTYRVKKTTKNAASWKSLQVYSLHILS